MKSKSIGIFTVLVLLIAFAAYVAAFGLPLGKYDIVPLKDVIKLGLDLRGGATVLLQAKDEPTDPLNDEKMERAVATIRERVDSLGVAEPTINRQGTNRIEVQLPEIQDPQRAIEIIGQTAKLEFKDEDGNVIITGADIDKANAVMSGELGQTYVVAFELKSEGTKKFAEGTKNNIGKPIGIYLDNNLISNPVVQVVIGDGKAEITGNSTREEALDLATLIRAGALPVELEVMQQTLVGPQLGANSFNRSIMAGGIGIMLVMLFMIIYYRLPGFVSVISLVLYTIIVLGILAGMNATLTLPGIAGIILSVGMAVDANVIIFERIKEELKIGKTLRAAIDSGFRRAFLTIFDSNITTLLAAGILFYFGTGPIKGFAVTLSIGILSSMFTAIVITRYLIKLLVKGGIVKNTKYFGA
ncbi:MAG: preprotein translocase subunit SecD [Clostridia bacterium]|jgi:preprotein translocase subunit SecD|nr:preprotein translocase subunit SecD [Clostridia bacterium]